MNTKVSEYFTEYKRPFTTAHGTRSGTEVVLLEIEHNGVTGHGEASIPPYRTADPQHLANALKQVAPCQIEAGLDNALDHYEHYFKEQPEAMAAFDMALHDLFAKKADQTVTELLQIPTDSKALNMYTIACENPLDIEPIVQTAPDTDLFKLKLTGTKDLEKINQISVCTDRPIFIDANQGWTSCQNYDSLFLEERSIKVVGVEQPFSTQHDELAAELSHSKNIEVYADESFERITDLKPVSEHFDGINIKLMKCGGIRNALQIMREAKKTGLKIMLGSMSETSCGTAAALQLAHFCDLLDQDGPWLLKNDPFKITNSSGTGAYKTH